MLYSNNLTTPVTYTHLSLMQQSENLMQLLPQNRHVGLGSQYALVHINTLVFQLFCQKQPS